MKNRKFIELAKKLKALANRGYGGEKNNAEEALKRLMHKHDISLADLESDVISKHNVKIPKGYKWLFIQTACNHGLEMWESRIDGKLFSQFFKCTQADFLSFQSEFEMLLDSYKRQIEVFKHAFIMKHELWPKSGNSRDISELSEKERDEFINAQKMASGIEQTALHKRIGGSV